MSQHRFAIQAVITGTLAALAVGCAPMDEATANKALLHQYHVDVWEHHDVSKIDQYIDPQFVSHANPPDTQPGPESVKGFMGALFTAFPDLTSQEDGALGDGDRVAIQWTIRATHTGYLFGMPPTGKSIEVSGMDVMRVKEGRLIEHWGGIGDQFPKIYTQLQQ